MNAIKMAEEITYNRRSFLSSAAMTIAAAPIWTAALRLLNSPETTSSSKTPLETLRPLK